MRQRLTGQALKNSDFKVIQNCCYNDRSCSWDWLMPFQVQGFSVLLYFMTFFLVITLNLYIKTDTWKMCKMIVFSLSLISISKQGSDTPIVQEQTNTCCYSIVCYSTDFVLGQKIATWTVNMQKFCGIY